jgi:hypothetical protein
MPKNVGICNVPRTKLMSHLGVSMTRQPAYDVWYFCWERMTIINGAARWRRHCTSMSYHVPHQSQVNTQSSGLPPRTPSLLENPLTFFTNTRHPSQCYHLSFSTKKDCIFPRNTIVNIDVAPRLPVRHIIT